MKRIAFLLRKELILEVRQMSIISGLAIYLFSTVFICYLAFSLHQNHITPLEWSALFWITVLFTVVTSVAKSFIGEKNGRSIYYYSLASPTSIILSKIIYNFFLCLLLGLTGFLLFVLYFQNPILDLTIFIVLLFFASFGFASSLTLLSSIASKTNNSSIVMAVLSFPVIIGILLMSIKITKNCIDGLDRAASLDELLTLVAINLLVTAVSYLLFPYIWRS